MFNMDSQATLFLHYFFYFIFFRLKETGFWDFVLLVCSHTTYLPSNHAYINLQAYKYSQSREIIRGRLCISPLVFLSRMHMVQKPGPASPPRKRRATPRICTSGSPLCTGMHPGENIKQRTHMILSKLKKQTFLYWKWEYFDPNIRT